MLLWLSFGTSIASRQLRCLQYVETNRILLPKVIQAETANVVVYSNFLPAVRSVEKFGWRQLQFVLGNIKKNQNFVNSGQYYVLYKRNSANYFNRRCQTVQSLIQEQFAVRLTVLTDFRKTTTPM